MITQAFVDGIRALNTQYLSADLLVAGGGMSGVCAAITAARAGKSVVLVQDRPVLGGNASSEVRLWILGATSHMGNNNRYAREGGIIDEILLENLYRNKEGNTLLFDTILLEKVRREPGITLLLNTSVYEVRKSSSRTIQAVKAFCSQNSTLYTIHSKYYTDATGDGIVSFLAGAAFRMGAESPEEFGEKLAPDESYGELLGHSLYFYSKRAPAPVSYVAPDFALKDISSIPRYKVIDPRDHGCRLWWIEYGGRRDTVHDTEAIKWELWKVVYGVWDYIKNSGEFEDTENLTLEWVGTIPGKRESRRFEGLYMLRQQDIVEQRSFYDSVAFGGWSLDMHPADGVYSEKPGCNQWHSKGIYEIPLRCYISKDIDNLFFAGRIISVSHVAFSSARVMGTGAHGAQAVGESVALCLDKGIRPKELISTAALEELRDRLNYNGQSIPGIPISPAGNLAQEASIRASSTLRLAQIPFDGIWKKLSYAAAQLLPLSKGTCYRFDVSLKASEETTLVCELQVSSKVHNYTPDRLLQKITLNLQPGEQQVHIEFDTPVPEEQYGMLIFRANEKVQIRCSELRLTGIVSVFQKTNKAVSNFGEQVPDGDIGVEGFELWIPERRPEGWNIAMNIYPALECFGPDRLLNGFTRPWLSSNAWISATDDPEPALYFTWKKDVRIKNIRLFLDTDFDHPLESALLGHPERITPFVVQEITAETPDGKLLGSIKNNYLSVRDIPLREAIETRGLVLRFRTPGREGALSLFHLVIKGEV